MTGLARVVSKYSLPLVLAVAALLVVYGRFVLQARGAVRAGNQAIATGDWLEATRSYRDALRSYVPGGPYERQALDGLEALAMRARKTGDHDGERAAWDGVRIGLLGTRSFYVPYAADLAAANQHIADLDATATFPSPAPEFAIVSIRGNGPGRSVRPLGPAAASTLVGLVGFAIWVGAIVLLIRRGLERGPRGAAPAPGPRIPRALLSVLFMVGFALFLIGMRFA